MKKLFLFLVLGMIFNLLQSQEYIPVISDYQKFLKSKTMVVYDEVLMSDFNVRIKDIMERSWKITPFDFITTKEFEKMKHDPELSFLLMTVVTFDKDKIKARYNFLSLLMGQPDKKIGNLPDLCSIPMSYAQNDEESYSYKYESFIHFIQSHIRTVLADPSFIGENALRKYNKEIGKLSTKTLYLLKDEMSADINTIQKVRAIYKFPVEFVTREDIENAIARQDKNVVFLHKVGPENIKTKARVYKIIVGAGDAKLYWWDYEMIKEAKEDALQAKDLKKMK